MNRAILMQTVRLHRSILIKIFIFIILLAAGYYTVCSPSLLYTPDNRSVPTNIFSVQPHFMHTYYDGIQNQWKMRYKPGRIGQLFKTHIAYIAGEGAKNSSDGMKVIISDRNGQILLSEDIHPKDNYLDRLLRVHAFQSGELFIEILAQQHTDYDHFFVQFYNPGLAVLAVVYWLIVSIVFLHLFLHFTKRKLFLYLLFLGIFLLIFTINGSFYAEWTPYTLLAKVDGEMKPLIKNEYALHTDTDSELTTAQLVSENIPMERFDKSGTYNAYSFNALFFHTLSKAKKLLVQNTSEVWVFSTIDNYQIYKIDSDIVPMNLAPLQKLHPTLLFYACLTSAILALLLVQAICAGWLKRFVNNVKENKLIYIPIFIFLTSFYFIYYPAIYGFDIVAQNVARTQFNAHYSAIYMIFAYMISNFGYGAFIILHMILFLFSIYHILSIEKISVKKKALILLCLFVLFICPPFHFALFAQQRFFTMLWFLFGSLTALAKSYYCRDENSYTTAAVLYMIAILLRIEYVLLAPLYIYTFVMLRPGIKKSVYTFFILLLPFLIVYAIGHGIHHHKMQVTYKYQAISLKAIANNYINDTEIAQYPFLQNPQNAEDLKQYKNWFIKKVLDNPIPYYKKISDQFANAMFSPNSWEHPHDKYIILKIHKSYHSRTSVSTMLLSFHTMSPKAIYSKILQYISINSPWFKNGILIAFSLCIFIFPVLFRKDFFLLFSTLLILLKQFFTIAVAPFGFSEYYYDIVIWCIIAICIFIVRFRRVNNNL